MTTKTKKIGYFLALLLITLSFLFFVSRDLILPNLFKLRSATETKHFEPQLDSLAKLAIAAGDVPVSSILIYNGKIIGQGFNTVYGENEVWGHAEMNAMNDVVKKMGLKSFMKLNRDSLQLISTFEPCAMCRGALIEYNINNVCFILPKTTKDKIKNEQKEARYFWKRTNGEDPYFQYQLFLKHPQFDSLVYPFRY